jgi:hypothetical protein
MVKDGWLSGVGALDIAGVVVVVVLLLVLL